MTALLALIPLFTLIAIAIKLDSDGPIFFKQKRTRRFGGEFTFIKFRTMVENAEDLTGVTISAEDAGGHDPRVTRVGRILRKTHLDEAPQLWSVLIGDMSVVGPRPAQAGLEDEFEEETPEWGKRWFVKPGLTGLAQINDVTGHEPHKKLRYDLEYIRQQSLTFDLKIVMRQFWKVAVETGTLIRDRG
jgi:lipopolysaccharide/colanic/teichoic acid biosynthesis glycosyltransferase